MLKRGVYVCEFDSINLIENESYQLRYVGMLKSGVRSIQYRTIVTPLAKGNVNKSNSEVG